MQVYEITVGDGTCDGSPPRHYTDVKDEDKKLFVADDVAGAVTAAQEWIGNSTLYVRDVTDLGRVVNCYVGQEA